MGKPSSKSDGVWQNKIRPFLGKMKYNAGAPVRWLQQKSIHPVSLINGGPEAAIARLHSLYELTPEVVLAGYLQGIFPTGEKGDRIVWHCPNERAVIQSCQVHVSRRLRGYLNKSQLEVTYNQQFEAVITACADRAKTWITKSIRDVYCSLHEQGYAHSVEATHDGELVGGGYGVTLGRTFYLESMFCRQDQASKVAFVNLARKLEEDGFETIDCQFPTEHWKRFGAKPIPFSEFRKIIVSGLANPAIFSNLSSTSMAGKKSDDNGVMALPIVNMTGQCLSPLPVVVKRQD